jgi:hypothetical protein
MESVSRGNSIYLQEVPFLQEDQNDMIRFQSPKRPRGCSALPLEVDPRSPLSVYSVKQPSMKRQVLFFENLDEAQIMESPMKRTKTATGYEHSRPTPTNTHSHRSLKKMNVPLADSSRTQALKIQPPLTEGQQENNFSISVRWLIFAVLAVVQIVWPIMNLQKNIQDPSTHTLEDSGILIAQKYKAMWNKQSNDLLNISDDRKPIQLNSRNVQTDQENDIDAQSHNIPMSTATTGCMQLNFASRRKMESTVPRTFSILPPNRETKVSTNPTEKYQQTVYGSEEDMHKNIQTQLESLLVIYPPADPDVSVAAHLNSLMPVKPLHKPMLSVQLNDMSFSQFQKQENHLHQHIRWTPPVRSAAPELLDLFDEVDESFVFLPVKKSRDRQHLNLIGRLESTHQQHQQGLSQVDVRDPRLHAAVSPLKRDHITLI